MLQYLIVLLDDVSTSYCHYNSCKLKPKLIGVDDVSAGILFAMKKNLMVQFVYPDNELPQGHKEVIKSVRHSKIVPWGYQGKAEIVVMQDWRQVQISSYETDVAYVFRTSKEEFFKNFTLIGDVLPKVSRLNVIITDPETFVDNDIETYQFVLSKLSLRLAELYKEGKVPQLNLLTDRVMLNSMNNCNSGWESITLAPNGKFYICPAFYFENETDCIGDLKLGLDIKNPQLYQLNHAPLCRNCDAYQCKRCIYLNRKMTLEVNTPSHEQCVMSHLERNASRFLLQYIRQSKTLISGQEIEEIEYLDPFDVRKK